VKSLLKAVSTGAASGSGISSYLSTVAVTSARVGGAGITSFQDTVPTNQARMGGAGIISYLDTIERECNAIAPTDKCAPAIANYMEAVSSGNTAPSVEGAKAIGSYLDALGNAASQRVGGAGIQSYLDTVATGTNRQGGAGIGSYQDSVGSAPAVKNFLDALSSGAAAAPSAPAVASYAKDVASGNVAPPVSGSGIASYLSTVPVTSARVGGAGITSYQDTVATTSSRVSGAGIASYADSVNTAPAVPIQNVPVPISTAVADPVVSVLAANPNVTPTTTVDTQVSQDGLQTTITITSVTTVVIDDSP
jgi:hypothetical protein